MCFISEAFFLSVLWIVHTVFSFYISIKYYARIIYNLLRRQLDSSGLADVRKAKDELTKIPEHIAFIILDPNLLFGASNQQPPSMKDVACAANNTDSMFVADSLSRSGLLGGLSAYSDLANLVVYSLAVGIHNITLYDLHGHLKRDRARIFAAIAMHMKQHNLNVVVDAATVSSSLWRLSWQLPTSGSGASSLPVGPPQSNGVRDSESYQKQCLYPDVNGNNGHTLRQRAAANGTNGHRVNGTNGQRPDRENGVNPQAWNQVEIAVLDSTDGKEDVVSAARELSRTRQPEDITEAVLDQSFMGGHRRPDPNLVLRIGLPQTNADFLPWQMRLSEIHSWDTLVGFRKQHYIDLLRRYSRCEQRFGK